MGQCPTNVPLYIIDYNLSLSEEIINILLNANFSEKVNKSIMDWLKYKKEKKSMFKPMGFQQFISKLKNELIEHKEDEFVEAVKDSMSKNYQGYFYPKLNNNLLSTQGKKTTVDGSGFKCY